ncbi:MAG: ATP synthase F1 subunit epsilon [Nitriliruptoraceae bacterium]|nr:ATP synthase F1 subunit epsilon [Nitriliruptoraceae bacterium]
MADTLMHVEVVSAESHVFSADIRGIFARGVEGEIGILPGHQPAVIALDIGAVTLQMADDTRALVAVHRGVLFVGADGRVIVLADIAELGTEIDVERAERRKAEIERRLASGPDAALASSLAKQNLRLDVARSASGVPSAN